MSDNDMRQAIEDAYEQAKYTYECANKNPMDHGHVMIKGLDGRTTLAKELQKYPHVHVEKGGYHGTTVHLEGVSRYLSAQRGAYDAFIKTLQEHGIDTQEMRLWKHAN